MASKRDIKRQVKYMIYDVIDECYFLAENNGKDKEAEKTVDEAVAFHEEIIPAINGAKSKKDFAPIIKKVEDKQKEFVESLNALNG